MGKESRDKGARFERWVAKRLRERGWSAERKRQAAAYDADADVIAERHRTVEGLLGPRRELVALSVECKNRKVMPSAAMRDAWAQAESAAKGARIPMVVIKRPGTSRAFAVLDLDTLLGLIG